MFFGRRHNTTTQEQVQNILSISERTPIQNPLNQQEWLRVFPNDNSSRHALPIGTLLVKGAIDLEPRAAVQKVQRHLQQLGAIGIANPIKKQFLVEGETPADARWYSICHTVSGTDGIELRNNPVHRDAFTNIGQKLLEYADWIEASGEPHMLWDIQYPSQYMLGTIPKQKQPQPYLIDVDPILITSREHVDGLRTSIQHSWLDRAIA